MLDLLPPPTLSTRRETLEIMRSFELRYKTSLRHRIRHCRALDLTLIDRQIQQPCDHSEGNRQIPHDIVAPKPIVEQATQPCAKEAADLVAEKREAGKHREVTHAEHLRDDAVGWRHCR